MIENDSNGKGHLGFVSVIVVFIVVALWQKAHFEVKM